jgi:hypothetical protein
MRLQAYVEFGIRESEKIQSSAENVNEECKGLCNWCRELLAENERLEDLVELAMDANDRNNGVIRQYTRVRSCTTTSCSRDPPELLRQCI